MIREEGQGQWCVHLLLYYFQRGGKLDGIYGT